ncbi:MAG: hypothetical protein JSS90_11325 [Bacteroidetes bacterium]|jgi:hypothetical protein|nr:hypothetical protein [Bacteroidota bacterium]
MKLGRAIKQKAANYLFYRELQKHPHTPRTLSFNDARTIGILYDATIERNYETVKAYVKHLRDDFKKDVLALGYYDGKELPPMRFSKLGLDFFTQKNLNWHFKPSHPMVSKFVNVDFDYLICLNIERNIPLKYISAVTKAGFKIGRYEKSSQGLYDFMISVNGNVLLPQFIDLVNNYLKHIGKDK